MKTTPFTIIISGELDEESAPTVEYLRSYVYGYINSFLGLYPRNVSVSLQKTAGSRESDLRKIEGEHDDLSK